MAEAPVLEAVREPVQERSRRTLNRILGAAERLLERRSFEEITIGEILRAARTSVGAFYTRFRDKDALLPALYERYDRSLEPALAALQEELERADAGLEEIARKIARHFVRLYRERRHLMGALAIYVRRHPGGVDARQRARRERQHRFLVRALAARRSGIGHENPERAAELALYFAVASIRDAVLFRESTHASAVRASDAELERETARMMLGYLTARP